MSTKGLAEQLPSDAVGDGVRARHAAVLSASGGDRVLPSLVLVRDAAARLPIEPPIAIAVWFRLVGFSLLPYLLMGCTWLYGARLVGVAIGDARLADLSPALVAPPPTRILLLHAVALLCALLPRGWAIGCAVSAGLGVVLGGRLLGLPALAAFAVFTGAMYLSFASRAPRWLKLALIPLALYALKLTALAAGWKLLSRNDITMSLLVMLWYACYRMTSSKPLGVAHFFVYIKTRLLFEGPVFTPDEFRAALPAEAAAIRRSAVPALAMALLARTITFQATKFLEASNWHASSGWALLGYSYVNYLILACQVVFGYGAAIALFRLFGVPIRDNFGAWYLARTPNEHWQRWNVLFREWLLTFVFYPLMRARVSLFVCVMTTLMISAVLHLFAALEPWFRYPEQAVLTTAYWALNGLAIYVVLAVPRRWPGLVTRLNLRESRVWWVVGWTLTSSFYAIAFAVHEECDHFAQIPAYFGRLLGLSAGTW